MRNVAPGVASSSLDCRCQKQSSKLDSTKAEAFGGAM